MATTTETSPPEFDEAQEPFGRALIELVQQAAQVRSLREEIAESRWGPLQARDEEKEQQLRAAELQLECLAHAAVQAGYDMRNNLPPNRSPFQVSQFTRIEAWKDQPPEDIHVADRAYDRALFERAWGSIYDEPQDN